MSHKLCACLRRDTQCACVHPAYTKPPYRHASCTVASASMQPVGMHEPTTASTCQRPSRSSIMQCLGLFSTCHYSHSYTSAVHNKRVGVCTHAQYPSCLKSNIACTHLCLCLCLCNSLRLYHCSMSPPCPACWGRRRQPTPSCGQRTLPFASSWALMLQRPTGRCLVL